MRLFRSYLLAAVLALLALALATGCVDTGGDDDTGGATAPADDKPVETATEDGGTAAEPETAQPILPPSDWPSFLQVYPGSDVKEASATEINNCEGVSAELWSGAGLDEIIEFYAQVMDEHGFYLWEETVSPIERYRRYVAPKYLIQIAAVRETEVTRILLDTTQEAPFEDGYPPYKLTWMNLNKLPEGFPTDLLPMDGMIEISSTILTDDGKLAVLDYLTSRQMDELDEFYSDFYTRRGWKREAPSRSDVAINLEFYKDGWQITTSICTYNNGQISVSLTHEPELPQQ